MNYNLSIPDIYNYNYNEKKILHNNFNIKLISTTLLPDTYYSLSEKGKLTKIEINKKYNEDNKDNEYDYHKTNYDNIRIYAFYFKINTHKIIMYINGDLILIHNNFLLLNTSNRRTNNSYDIYNKSDTKQYIDIYLICKNNPTLELISIGTILYDINSYDIINKTRWKIKYNSQYNDAMQTFDMMLSFYVKTKNDNLDNLIKFESNNIIFYFKYNMKSKITDKQYLYKYNLVKLEKKNTNIEYVCQLNNLQLYNISSVIDYLKYIDYMYDKIYDILNSSKNNYEYYFLDFKTFMIKNNIDEIYFRKISYDV